MATIGRPREFDRDAALEAAMLLFWRKGFAATSMTDLCEAMNIRSPSLYAAFGSKEALYLEASDYYVRTQGPPVWGQLAGGESARAGVERLLTAAAKNLPKSRTVPAGCMAALAGVGDEWPAAVADMVRRVRQENLALLRSRLKAAVSAGELSPSTDIDGLSRFYLSVYQGMAIQAKDGATTADLRDVAIVAMSAWPSKG